jgi:MFS family permease
MAHADASGYQFRPEEHPLTPGSPYTPAHPVLRRFAYGAVALGVGICATFGNALVTVNVASLAGALGGYQVQAQWLPSLYVAMNASANLLLIKGRTQYGIPAISRVVILLYGAMAVLQFLFPGYAAAVAIRAASGVAGAGLTTVALYSMMQALPAKWRLSALAVGIILPQLGTPLARMVPVEMLAQDGWRGLHLIELGIAFAAWALTTALPLPPTDCKRAFHRMDFVTFALLMPALVLLCGVLGLGRLVWWTDAPWLGVMLVGSVVLFTIAILIERSRTDPLLHLTWITRSDIRRFALVALMVRLALAEQTYGSVGLLTSGGLNNDQLRFLFFIVFLSMAFGAFVTAIVLKPERIRHLVMGASLLIALGAWLDSGANNLTRPPQLYLSQALIGFGTSLFLGPALLFGFGRMLQSGTGMLVSFIVLFNLTQNVGGLAGSALLGSYQVIETRAHAQTLAEHLVATDPQVASRLLSGATALSGAVVDPVLRTARGGALLTQALNREATVLAYNDVFMFVALIALATALYLAFRIVAAAREARAAALETMR